MNHGGVVTEVAIPFAVPVMPLDAFVVRTDAFVGLHNPPGK
jgi:hypothetical protein